MKVLVLSAFYPDNHGNHDRMYVHIRNRYYLNTGIDVSVINFNTDEDYDIDGVRVYSPKSYNKNKENYDLLISHASNIRNNLMFIRKNEQYFKKIVFFFHGHEILYINQEYPKPYDYVNKGSFVNHIKHSLYDGFKMRVWRHYYKKYLDKSEFVFVSEWIKNKFDQNIFMLNRHAHIINNSVGLQFEQEKFKWDKEKHYNYISIRSDLDGSKYCVDLFVKLARKNPKSSFLLIGKGKFFDFNEKPSNLTWIDKTLTHEGLLSYINDSECAILLTREDTQGVMTCEVAALGMPVITSNIEVCREIFSGIDNVVMVDNNGIENVNLDDIKNSLVSNQPFKKCTKYDYINTVNREIELLKSCV